MIDPLIVQILGALAQVVPGIIDALSPDVRATVIEEVRAIRARLPAAGSVTSATDAVIARHMATATRPSERIGAHHVGDLRALAASTSGALLSAADRATLLLVAADLERRVSDTLPPPMPPVLDADDR